MFLSDFSIEYVKQIPAIVVIFSVLALPFLPGFIQTVAMDCCRDKNGQLTRDTPGTHPAQDSTIPSHPLIGDKEHQQYQ